MDTWNKFMCLRCTFSFWIKLLIILCMLCSCHCKIFRIAWISPDKSSGQEINSFTSVAALKLALATVMTNPVILKGHDIEVEYFSTDCTPHMSMQAAMKAKAINPDVIIGPPCQEGMIRVAELCAFWNLPVFTWYNPGIALDSTLTYPTMIRMIPSLSTLGMSLLHLLRQNKWTNFALVYDDSRPWTLYEEAVRAAVTNTEVRMLSSYTVNSTVTDAHLLQMYNHIKKQSWIVVFACPWPDIRRYMLIAEEAGMAFGSHVFIQLDHQLYSEQMINSTVLSKQRWMRGDAKDQIAKRAYQSLIHVMLDSMNDDVVPTYKLPRNRYEEFVRMAVGGSKVQLPGWKLPPGGQPDVNSLYLYDAILMWSVLVEKLFSAGKNHQDGKLVVQEAEQFLADGASGFLSMNDNLDRVGKMFILYMEADGTFKPSQILKFNSSNRYDIINLKPLQEQLRYHGGQTKTATLMNTISPGAVAKPATTTQSAMTLLPSTKAPLLYNSTPIKSKTTMFPAVSATQSTNYLINRLLAKVQALEKSIKEHELHSHGQHILPGHSLSPQQLIVGLPSTPPTKSGQHIPSVHGQATPANVPSTQSAAGHIHWHPHYHYPQQGHEHPATLPGSQVHGATTNKPPPPRPPSVQTFPAPLPTTTLAPTTAAKTTTASYVTGDILNGNMDEAMIHRISSRIVDHLTGTTTNTTYTNNQETRIVNALLTHLDELPPALLLAIESARERRLLQQQNQRHYNNQNYQQPTQHFQNSQTQALPQQARVQQWRPPVYRDPLASIFDPIIWNNPLMW
ncbi:guanylate cyclase 2G-like [Mercenaria mercenaria]|uniref:guanylate cyclase 2G-like n=1 Tax=Mercenaria mercenaria TaxID=6596 RepID=UPI00234EF867|nr:guanylate cyclase 2G-like [Mercenaria mercenaria]